VSTACATCVEHCHNVCNAAVLLIGRCGCCSLQEAFKAREAELMAKSEASWKQYQEQRGEPVQRCLQ
jgi:hypothetical protein